jgi:hypothetical protein
MMDGKRLLEDLKRLLKRLEDDLRERTAAVPEMADRLRGEYHAVRDAGRTGAAFEAWRDEVLTQAAAAWILGSVFVRFMEDNALVDGPLISGPGERRGRAEIAMAREMAGGELSSTWFERHRSKPVTEVPAQWADDWRIALIGSDRYLGLIERPEHKRRWNQEAWEAQEQRALKGWLLDRLETGRYSRELRLQTTRSLSERAETDADFMRVAERYVGHAGFDLYPLVADLVEGESVPFLPVLRYKPSGLRKRQVWEETWRLQRREDAIDAEVEAKRTAVGRVGAECVTQGFGAGSLGYASLTQPTLANVDTVIDVKRYEGLD